MLNRNSPIGVFDSGLGGLTVVAALKHLLPNESIIYFGDTARVPYGTKSAVTVTHFSQQIASFLLKKKVKMIVVACNTASATALPKLQDKRNIPIIGVIHPGAKAASDLTRNNHIGVIGTTATIHSGAYFNALRDINPDLVIESIACPLFVPLVEEGWTEGSVATMVARRYLEPFSQNCVDTVILGCTHYPLLKDIIRISLSESVQLVDSAEAVSWEVEKQLQKRDALADSSQQELTCFVTDLPRKFEELGERFLGESLPDVSLVHLD